MNLFKQLNIQASSLLPIGVMALWRGGKFVWVGPVGSPIEDALFDAILLSPEDYATLKKDIETEKQRKG